MEFSNALLVYSHFIAHYVQRVFASVLDKTCLNSTHYTNKCNCCKTGAPGLYQKLSVGVFCLKNLSYVQNRTVRSLGSPP